MAGFSPESLADFAQNNQLSLFSDITSNPNPATGPIRISLPGANETGSQTGNQITVTISALTGTEIMQTTKTGARTSLDTTSLPHGIYLVKVNTVEGVFMGKLVRE